MREKAGTSKGKQSVEELEEVELRRGPWTLEEDTQLIHYIAHHGEGQWNMLAKSSGLKRTGKSCRLRWLNYLKPDVKRGNLTPQEQLLILHLHSKWGNRWSKIAQHLPGRTDNEIKNYWRTRVQKHARQLNIESNSENFVDPIRLLWTPTLQQKMEQTISSSIFSSSSTAISATPYPPLSSSSQSIMMTNSENPCSETSETADFSRDYSKFSFLHQNEEHPSIFMQNKMNLNNSIINNNCYEENENSYNTWDFNLGNSPALEMHDMSDIDSHLAEPESNWDVLDTLWNIDIV